MPAMAPHAFPAFTVGQTPGRPRIASSADEALLKPDAPPATATQANPVTERLAQGLAGHIRAKWEAAKQHKEQSGVAAQILRAKRARDQQYEPAKLAAIKRIHGNDYEPPYDPVIDVKCRALEAYLTDIILTPGDRPWSIEPTPIPDLPEEVRATIDSMVEQRVAEQVVLEAIQQGRMPTIDEVEQRTQDVLPAMRDALLAQMKRKAREAAEKLTQKIDDQLTEGGWHAALKQILYDFVTYPAAFLKGPTLRRDRRIKQKFNETTRRWEVEIETRKIDTWSRVSPDKIFPEPHAVDINSGGLIELSSYKRKDLYDAIGIEGYKEDAIRRVLAAHDSGGLHEWTLLDHEKKTLEKKSTYDLGSDIDCLIYWDTAPGKLLLEWGMPSNIITDAEREYDIWAELIGTEVIMARLNPDPLGQKPYYRACLIDDPDRFWNKAVPDLLWDLSGLCNAVLRASGVNAAFAAGPMVDIAVDRLENPNDDSVYPLRKFRSTSKNMAESKVVNFYQPQLLTAQLGNFLEFLHRLADEWSGVLRLSHGGDQSLPNTASTTSMFISQSSRGVKQYAKNIDVRLIEPSVTKQYQVDLWEQKDPDFASPYNDAKIVARGSSSLIAKEQQAVRRNEFAGTLSAEDKLILGQQGLKELLRQRIQSLEMDTDKLLPDDQDLIESMTGWRPGPQATPGLPAPQAPEALNAAGDRSSGRDFALAQGAA